MRTKLPLRSASVVALSAAMAACTVGPNYHRPPAAISPHFKEAEGWRAAQAVEAIDRGAWWSVFNDSDLDALEKRVEVNNQNIAQAVAAYREAHQITAAARASFFPTLGATGQVHDQYSGSKGGSSVTTASGAIISGGGSNSAITTLSAALNASWTPDLWGSIRREVESDVATAQADAGQIANARLSAQGELATDYYELRINDATQQVLRDTVTADEKFLTLTKNQYAAGTMDRAAIISAQTQVLGVQAQLVDLQAARAQDEHAIAILIGVAPSELTIAPIAKSEFDVPVPPVTVPSDLLERRPDIAVAERNMAAANATIGVKVAAFYPTLPLTASYSYSGGSNLGNLFSATNELWTAGASLTDTIVDFGARRAQVRAARAAYDEQIAVYRQTVLSAFQGVEDNLAQLRVFQQEADVRKQALDAANYAVQLTINEYKAGTVDYTTVITAQTTALTDAQAVLTVEQERLVASVALIQNLGGGWQANELPKKG
ncbi:MAG: efflux transporter outer membrane subunit [Caulobacteraceae bacterium]